MGKNTTELVLPEAIETVEDVDEPNNEQVFSTLQKIFGDKGKEDNNDINEIENIKLIISAILNDELLESLTNLEPEELDDINDAIYLNQYFDNPRIDLFILHRLKLSRSKVKDGLVNNLLSIFSDISGKAMRNEQNTGSILDRFRK